MDNWKLADPESATDIHHSPDFALVDAQGRATLFDFTQPRPITRDSVRMVNYCDSEQSAYLKVAEKKKRESHWRFVRRQFAGMARFVPLAMDWDGAFGPTFTQVLKGWANTEIRPLHRSCTPPIGRQTEHQTTNGYVQNQRLRCANPDSQFGLDRASVALRASRDCRNRESGAFSPSTRDAVGASRSPSHLSSSDRWLSSLRW